MYTEKQTKLISIPVTQGNFARTHEWKLIWKIYNFPFQTHTWESCKNLIKGIHVFQTISINDM